MEISRHFKAALNVTGQEPASVQRSQGARTAAPATASSAPVSAEPSRLEPLQNALQSMPDVDLDKVAALKAALARGELSSDPQALASSILTYHRGSDA